MDRTSGQPQVEPRLLLHAVPAQPVRSHLSLLEGSFRTVLQVQRVAWKKARLRLGLSCGFAPGSYY